MFYSASISYDLSNNSTFSLTLLLLVPAMFSLFICVTQDGWMEIFEAFQVLKICSITVCEKRLMYSCYETSSFKLAYFVTINENISHQIFQSVIQKTGDSREGICGVNVVVVKA